MSILYKAFTEAAGMTPVSAIARVLAWAITWALKVAILIWVARYMGVDI